MKTRKNRISLLQMAVLPAVVGLCISVMLLLGCDGFGGPELSVAIESDGEHPIDSGGYIAADNEDRVVLTAVVPSVSEFVSVEYEWTVDGETEWVVNDATGEVQSCTEEELVTEFAPNLQTEYEIAVTVTADGETASDSVTLEVGSPEGWDTDRDGIIDEREINGWYVEFDFNMDNLIERGDQVVAEDDGTARARQVVYDDTDEYYHVTSDPESADTDGDGLDDAEEYLNRTDPNVDDTDSDGLTDGDEYNIYLSSPARLDSDGDALKDDGTWDTQFYDGIEALSKDTSPILADTDGDGINDRDEILSGGTDPLVADLPNIVIYVNTAPALALNGTYTIDQKTTSISTTLTKSSFHDKRATSHSLNLATEASAKISASAEYTYPAGGKVSAGAEASFGASSSYTMNRSYEADRSLEAQRSLQQSIESRESITFSDGTIGVTVAMKNIGLRSVNVDNLRVHALKRNLLNPFADDTFITELTPDIVSESLPVGEEKEVAVTNPRVNPNLMMDLLNDPQGLYFKVAAFDFSDSTGNEYNYASIKEMVARQTSQIHIDYGLLSTRDPETFFVATNMERDDRGRPIGANLYNILTEWLDMTIETDTTTDGREVVTTIRDVSNDPDQFTMWVLVGNCADLETSSEDDTELPIDFSDITLKPTETLTLLYVRDSDGDGLWDRLEALYGTNPYETNTDGDKVPDGNGGFKDFTDFEEVNAEDWGWYVTVQGWEPYASHGDPRYEDRDGDFLPDWVERELGTNPNEWDTDGDGWIDYCDATKAVEIGWDTLTEAAGEDLITYADYLTHVEDETFEQSSKSIKLWGDGDYRRGVDFSNLEIQDFALDSDKDGITNFQELKGWYINTSVTPHLPMLDDSASAYFTDPQLSDEDCDGLSDLEEVDGTNTGTVGGEEKTFYTHPKYRDTDGDMDPDGVDPDPMDPNNFRPALYTNFDVYIEKIVRVKPTSDVTEQKDLHMPCVSGWIYTQAFNSSGEAISNRNSTMIEYHRLAYWNANDSQGIGDTITLTEIPNESGNYIQVSAHMWDIWWQTNVTVGIGHQDWDIFHIFDYVYIKVWKENKSGFMLEPLADQTFQHSGGEWPYNGNDIYYSQPTSDTPVRSSLSPVWTDKDTDIQFDVIYTIKPSAVQPDRLTGY